MTQFNDHLFLFRFENPIKIVHSIFRILCKSTEPQPWPSPISFTLFLKRKSSGLGYVEVCLCLLQIESLIVTNHQMGVFLALNTSEKGVH